MSYYQQGDVIIKRAKGKITGKKLDHGILAEGEATGHKHEIKTGNYDLIEKDGELYLINKEEVTVTHQEHSPINLPPGKWSIGIVQEFDPFKEEARKVID